jgi:glycosyltransferase involved in cell wall biosynthesis
MTQFDICLVSPSHLASNPRLVKEADALAGAGWRVAVVCGDHYAPVREFDNEIRRSRSWSVFTVNYEPRLNTLGERAWQKIARRLLRIIPSASVKLAAPAHHSCHYRLVRAALATGSSLFIGHTVAGLAAAAEAASEAAGEFGFDAEDFHSAETDTCLSDPGLARSIQIIESQRLPLAAFITAASPLIAAAYQTRYSIPLPSAILNVFPLAMAPATSREKFPVNKPIRAYWFSQTLGAGRGLEEIISVLGRMETPVSLHLRGHVDSDYRKSVLCAAARGPRPVLIEFLPPAPADEMVRLAAEFDVGLSLEQSTPLNRDLCLTNKIFTYLLAGLPVIATATQAQSNLAQTLPDAIKLIDFGSPATTARQLDDWFNTPDAIENASKAAATYAQEIYNWDTEKTKLLSLIQHSGWQPRESR